MSVYLASGIGLGVILIAVYVYRAWPDPDLQVGVQIFIAAVGVSSGVKLFVAAVTTSAADIKPLGNEDRAYIILGAIALVWVSALFAIRTLVETADDDDESDDGVSEGT